MVLYLFDLLYLDGRDLRPSPLVDRKAALAALLRDTERPLRHSEHFEEDGELVLRLACRLSLYSVGSKECDAPYRSGGGTPRLKYNFAERQAFVADGLLRSCSARSAISPLMLHSYLGGKAI